jgi:hypothetical protein
MATRLWRPFGASTVTLARGGFSGAGVRGLGLRGRGLGMRALENEPRGASGESGACGRKLLAGDVGIGCGGGLFIVPALDAEAARALWP